jgi:TolA-binding protein
MSKNKAFIFTALILTFPILWGCAEDEPKTDVGHLVKMGAPKKDVQTSAEQTRLHDMIKHEREEYRRQLSKKYPMPANVNEESLYAEVVRAFQTRQIDAVDNYADAFLLRYPQSVFADKALYLKGEIHLIMGFPTEALREFERVISEYPTGNKYTAALFGKGVCYRKLQLYQYAEKVMEDIRSDYPGSPEFYKSDLERKMIKAEAEAVEPAHS